MRHFDHQMTRREALRVTVGTAATVMAAPYAHSQSKTDSGSIIIGEGEHQYEIQHAWPQLPDQFSWQTTHNVAVDQDNNLYVIHEGRAELKDHPSIFVFGPDGRYIRSFGSQFQGGGHGIEVRKEGTEQFLYVCAYQQCKTFAKMTLKGDTIWQKYAPMDAGVYAMDEDTNPQKIWGRDRFMPTNFAFLPDGDFFLADGYGSFTIHRYDRDGQWKHHFGGPGKGQGTFNTPHGIWIDDRPGREPAIVVCDRAHHTLQYLTLEGKHLETLSGYGLPANIDTRDKLLLVPELHARLTLLDQTNRVVARLGADVQRVTSGRGIRSNPAQWNAGKFVHPHDACFDHEGNIFVAEWVSTGRISRLTRMG